MPTVLAARGAAQAIANGTPVAGGQYLFSTKLTMTNIPRAEDLVRQRLLRRARRPAVDRRSGALLP